MPSPLIIRNFLDRFFSFQTKYTEEIPSFTQIYLKNELITEKFNSVELQKSSIAHSEIESIRHSIKSLKSKYLNECSLITTLEPCLMCSGAIILSRITKVIYFLPAEKGIGISSLPIELIFQLNYFPELELIEDEKLRKVFKNFFKDKRF